MTLYRVIRSEHDIDSLLWSIVVRLSKTTRTIFVIKWFVTALMADEANAYTDSSLAGRIAGQLICDSGVGIEMFAEFPLQFHVFSLVLSVCFCVCMGQPRCVVLTCCFP